ncbi:hypothetical protein SALBM217S_08037 [Streptomyces griseoloalbus]
MRIDVFRVTQPSPAEPLDPVLMMLTLVIFVVLLVAVGRFIGTAVRFAGERRGRGLEPLRLVGLHLGVAGPAAVLWWRLPPLLPASRRMSRAMVVPAVSLGEGSEQRFELQRSTWSSAECCRVRSCRCPGGVTSTKVSPRTAAVW